MPQRISYLLACVTVLILPLYTIRFEISSWPTTVLEIAILLTVAVWLAETTWRKEWTGWRDRLNNPLLWLGLGLVGWSLVEAGINPDHRSGLGLWRAYFAEPFIFGLVVLDLIRRGERAKWIIYSLVGSGIWLSLMGLSQFLLHQPVTMDSLHEVEQGRAAAVFNSANALALYLGPVMALTTLWSLRQSKKWWVPTLVLFAAILATKSEGAKLGLGAIETLVIISFFWNKFRPAIKTWIWRISLVGVIVGLAAAVVLFLNISSFTPKTHFTYPRTYTDTKTIRLCLWEGTKQVLTGSPLVGTGLGGFKDVYFNNRTCDSEPLEYPHNLLLNWWVTTGIIGLVLYLILQTRIFLMLKDSRNQALALGLAAAFGYWLLHGLVDVPYFKNDLAVEFWLLALLVVVVAERKLAD